MTSTSTTPVRQPSSPGFARWEWSPSDTAYYAHSGVAACPPRALAYSRALRRPLSQWGDICPPNSQVGFRGPPCFRDRNYTTTPQHTGTRTVERTDRDNAHTRDAHDNLQSLPRPPAGKPYYAGPASDAGVTLPHTQQLMGFSIPGLALPRFSLPRSVLPPPRRRWR